MFALSQWDACCQLGNRRRKTSVGIKTPLLQLVFPQIRPAAGRARSSTVSAVAVAKFCPAGINKENVLDKIIEQYGKIENLYKLTSKNHGHQALSENVKIFTLRSKIWDKRTVFHAGSLWWLVISAMESQHSACFRPIIPTSDLRAAVGNVTRWLHQKQIGDTLAIRGPYGNGFPIARWIKSVIMAAGGVGIPPLVPLIEYVIKNKKSSRKHICFRAATPKDLLFKRISTLAKQGLDICLTIDVWRPAGREDRLCVYAL